MTDKIIDQWEKVIKSNTDYLNKANQKSVEALDNVMGKYWNWSNFARIGKAFMDSSQEIRKNNETLFNSMMKTFLGTMNLKATANSVKEFNDIGNDAATRLFKNQQDWLNIFSDSDENILDGMAQARGAQDIAILMMQVFSEMNGKLKENFTEYLKVCGDIESAVKIWGSRTLSAEAAGTAKS